MLLSLGSLGHAISGYLLATAVGGEHRDPIVPELSVMTSAIGAAGPAEPDHAEPANPPSQSESQPT